MYRRWNDKKKYNCLFFRITKHVIRLKIIPQSMRLSERNRLGCDWYVWDGQQKTWSYVMVKKIHKNVYLL